MSIKYIKCLSVLGNTMIKHQINSHISTLLILAILTYFLTYKWTNIFHEKRDLVWFITRKKYSLNIGSPMWKNECCKSFCYSNCKSLLVITYSSCIPKWMRNQERLDSLLVHNHVPRHSRTHCSSSITNSNASCQRFSQHLCPLRSW